LFGLAPCGVCPASAITDAAVRSYRTFSPLPRWFLQSGSRGTESLSCCKTCLRLQLSKNQRGGIFSVALSVPRSFVRNQSRKGRLCLPQDRFSVLVPKERAGPRTLSGTLLCGVRTFLPAHSSEINAVRAQLQLRTFPSSGDDS